MVHSLNCFCLPKHRYNLNILIAIKIINTCKTILNTNLEQKPNQKKSKIKHKRVKTFLGNTPISLPATVLNSPFSSKNDIGTFKSS